MTLEELFVLVDRYEATASVALERLREQFEVSNVFQAAKMRCFPRSGCFGDVTYAFHGSGCWTRIDDLEVGFEFDSDGTIGGYDAWRLHLFSPTVPVDELNRALSQGVLEKKLTCREDAPCEHLFVRTPVAPSMSE